MRKFILMIAAVSLALAACSRQQTPDAGEPPASAVVNGVSQVNRDTGEARLNVSALDDDDNAIEGHISAVSVQLDAPAAGTGLSVLQNLTATAGVCQQIVVRGAVHGVISLDASGSMDWNDPDEHRADAAKQLVARLGAGAQLAIASFPATYPDNYTLHQDFTEDKALLESAIDEATFASGGTPLWDSSIEIITDNLSGSEQNKVLLVLTDGEDYTFNGPDNTITAANDNGVRIYFVGLGEPTSLDGTSMTRVANETGGLYGRAAEPTELASLFNSMLQSATASGEICLTFSPNPVPEGTEVSGTVTLTIGGRDYDAPFAFEF